MPEPHLRAADTDREAVATALGQHMASGRLTVAEYEERLAQAYAAKTYGDLDALTADLPAPAAAGNSRPVDAEQAPALPPPGTAVCGPARYQAVPPLTGPWGWHGRGAEHSWRAWLATSATVLVVYLAISLASWEFHYFWPIWVIGPWGAALLAHRFAGTGRGSGHDDSRRLGA